VELRATGIFFHIIYIKGGMAMRLHSLVYGRREMHFIDDRQLGGYKYLKGQSHAALQ
jgi:hypothetical protein